MVRRINLLSERSFPIAVNRMEPQHDIDLHHHDNLELVLITGGAGDHRAGDERYALQRGDVFMVPIGMPHGFDRTSALSLVNIAYDSARLELPTQRLSALPGYRPLVLYEPRLRQQARFTGHLRLDEAEIAVIEQHVRGLEEELRSRAPGWQHAANAYLLQILVRLARCYAAMEAPAAQHTLRIAEVLHYIEANLDQTLTLGTLSARGRMSPSTLQRSFRAVVGTSVLQHVLDQRLKAAQDLLASTDLPVREVARRVGIADQNYFARLFRARTGRQPRAHRRQHVVEGS